MPSGNQGEEVADEVAFTCLYTAGLRYVESTKVANPLLEDHLAKRLCGPKALQLAEEELARLNADQGPGKHLRVPARTRIVDDKLMEALDRLTQQGSSVQVVSLGAGMDTRAWRCRFPAGVAVHYFEVDLPVIASLKVQLLAEAGAQMAAAAGHSADVAGADQVAAAAGHSADMAGGQLTAAHPADVAGAGPAFCLQCSSWRALPADLSQASLQQFLLAAGFDQTLPTVWIAEALVYYMPLQQASQLMQSMADVSGTSSVLIATCIDQELLEASRKMPAGHVFARLWHFNIEQLMASDGYSSIWRTTQQPASTRQWALDLYGADTYVPLYGGSELLFVADKMHVNR